MIDRNSSSSSNANNNIKVRISGQGNYQNTSTIPISPSINNINGTGLNIIGGNLGTMINNNNMINNQKVNNNNSSSGVLNNQNQLLQGETNNLVSHIPLLSTNQNYNPNINQNINLSNTSTQNNFYQTLRAYTQRLKQQRDISLSYLKKMNQMSEQLRKKDSEIARLNKTNKQLIQKLSVYQSVLTKSRIRSGPLRMSSFIDKNNMMQSIIQYLPPQETSNQNTNFIKMDNINQSPSFKPIQAKNQSPSSKGGNPSNIIGNNLINLNANVNTPNKRFHHNNLNAITPTQNYSPNHRQKSKSPALNKRQSHQNHTREKGQPVNLMNSARKRKENSVSPRHSSSTNQNGNIGLIRKFSQMDHQSKNKITNTNNMSSFKPLAQHGRQVKQKCQLFQQFFIVSPGQDNQIVYHYKHNKTDNKTQDCIKAYINHPQFILKPYQGNPTKTINKRILFIADSPYTSMKKQLRSTIPLVQDINPSYYYFGFCILQKQLMNMNGKYFWVPMVYGFISFYPFAQHFLKLIQNVAKDFPNFKDMRKLQDSLNSLNSTLNKIVINNGETSSLQLPAELKYTFFNKHQILKLPILQQIPSIVLSYSKDIFKNYAIQLIIDVLMLLLLEIPITVVSQDSQLLAKFMLYFVCLIKPLKYPFPIVFSLPQSMQILFQSPFPTFLGSTNSQMVDKYMAQRAVFDLDKKLAKSWPILQHLDSSRQYLMSLVSKYGNGHDIQKCGIIQTLLNGKNIKEIQLYWKDFSHTQIYQIYRCQQ